MNWPLLQNSLLVAGLTTVAAVLLGGLVALCLMSLGPRGRKLGLALAVGAFAMPPFVAVNCWLQYLGQAGEWRGWLPLNIFSLGGTVWILTLLTWPVATLLLLGAWRQLERAQLEADPAVTGRHLIRALLWPLGRGAVAQSAALVFVLALNNFAVPAILQVKVFPAELWVNFSSTFNYAEAWKLSWPMVVAPLLVLMLLAPRTIHWPRLSGGVSAVEFRRQLGRRWFGLACAMTAFLIAASVGLPLWQLAVTARTWTELPGAVEASAGALGDSIWLAALTATLTVGIGALAFRSGVQRCRRHFLSPHPDPLPKEREQVALDSASGYPRQLAPGQNTSLPLPEGEGQGEGKGAPRTSRLTGFLNAICSCMRALLWLPFFVPGVLLGIVFIALFNRPGLDWFYQSSLVVVAALALRYTGVAATGTSQALNSVDRDLVDAARLDGAGRWALLRHVLGPLALPQLAAAWYLVFLLGLWDVESIVLIMPPGGETLALRIFNLLHYGHNAQVNALCLTLLAVALAPLALWWIADCGLRIVDWRRRVPVTRALTGVTAALAGWFFQGCVPAAPSNSAPLESKLFERAEIIGSRGTGLGQFNKPRSLAVDRNDNLYVVDMTGRVQKFSPDGRYLSFWQMERTDKGKPKGMGRDRESNIILIEPHYSRVNIFSTNAVLVAQWGVHGTNAGELGMPRAVAVNSRGEIYVSEYTDSERIQRFAMAKSASGTNPVITTAKLINGWGQPGTAPGEFNRAEGIAVDSKDRVYVADSCNHRIQVFDADGKFLRAYGRPGSGVGELSYPSDICVDADGRQYVCEFGNSRIQVFDANDQPIEIIGGAGGAPGKFANPWALTLDSHGSLYVADALNHRVQKLIRKKAMAGIKKSDVGDGAALIGAADRSAELHSAVSPTCSRLDDESDRACSYGTPAAEYNSDIRQIENLRYEGTVAALIAMLPSLRTPHSALRAQ